MKAGAYVICELHGRELLKGGPKMVRTRIPRNKREQREVGCPVCRRLTVRCNPLAR